MPSLLERLRDDLRPDYEVERELGRGGQGSVFQARDVKLERPVAIKVLRPELATATAVEHFLTEARTLANLVHPNVVPVHVVGQAAQLGLPYYVMDLMRGETLHERLDRGPLRKRECLKIGRDVLAALEAVHAIGVVHRDVKPANIFLESGRALLGDFGIARSAPRDDTGKILGTPGYMPPEQAQGRASTPQTDLYALAMVLYQCYTGRRWEATHPGAPHNWHGVPWLQRRILRRALAWTPEDRWTDARMFRQRLWKTRVATYRLRTAAIAAGGVLGMLFVWWVARTPPTPMAELAVMPFASPGAADPLLGRHFARWVADNIEHPGVVPARIAFLAWDSVPPGPGRTAALLERLRARRLVTGAIEQQGNSMRARLTLVTDVDTVDLGDVVGTVDERGALACNVAHALVRDLGPASERAFRCNGGYVGKRVEALDAFHAGEYAEEGNRWADALDRYHEAVELDSTFALAAIRHYVAWSWLLTGRPHDLNLRALLAQPHHGLFTQDSLVLDAMAAGSDVERLVRYRRAVERFPRDGLLAYLYADLVLHRGPFLGIPLKEAERLWTVAAELDSTYSPAWHHLAWVRILLGDAVGATAALNQLMRWVGWPEQVGFLPQIFEFALVERFAPEQAPAARAQLLGEPQFMRRVAQMLRLAPTVGLTRTQLELAQGFSQELRRPTNDSTRMQLATFVEAEALARIAVGHVARGFTLVDSVAALVPSVEARLQAAGWRLITPSVRMPGVSLEARQMAAQSIHGLDHPRAWWALGVDAVERGDTVAAWRWIDRLQSTPGDTIAERLALLLSARREAERGAFDRALELSAPLLRYDSAAHGGDPFARSALHSWRGDWLERTRGPEAADSSRLWYLHSDHLVTPIGPAVPEEIDWALGTIGAWHRFRALADDGDTSRRCALARFVSDRWREPDPVFAPWRDETRAFLTERCPT